MKRFGHISAKDKGKWTCCDAEFLDSYPLLAQAMCDPWADDGKPRECCNLSIKLSGTTVLLTLSDPGEEAYASTTATSIEEGLALINQAIQDDTLRFRKWGRKKG